MFRVGILDTISKGLFEAIKFWMVFGIQALFADMTPETLNQIQMRRIGWQVQQFNAQFGGMLEYQVAFLITGIIEHNCNQHAFIVGRDFREQKTDAFGVNVSFVGDSSAAIASEVNSI